MQLLTKKVKLHYKLPKYYNNGKKIPTKKLIMVKNFFVDRYGGLSVDSPSEGYWLENGFMFKDVNYDYSIFISKTKFERSVKKQIPNHIKKFKKEFDQLAIFCYYYNVMST